MGRMAETCNSYSQRALAQNASQGLYLYKALPILVLVHKLQVGLTFLFYPYSYPLPTPPFLKTSWSSHGPLWPCQAQG